MRRVYKSVNYITISISILSMLFLYLFFVNQKEFVIQEKKEIYKKEFKRHKQEAIRVVEKASALIVETIEKNGDFVEEIKKLDTKDYIFVYKLFDKVEDNVFANMVYNPNRPDLEGSNLRIDYKDAKGKEFRREFLNEVNKKGDAFIDYFYAKPNTPIIDKKYSYFKLIKEHNLVVASGFYEEDIKISISKSLDDIDIRLNQNIIDFIKEIGLIAFIFVIVFYLLDKKANKINQQNEQRVRDKNRKLEKELILQKREIDTIQKILLEQTKYQSMAQMLVMLSQQFRQPLTSISLFANNIYFLAKYDDISKEYIIESTQKIVDTSAKMSDRFGEIKDFISTSNEPVDIKISTVIKKAVDIFEAKNKYNIDILANIKDEVIVHTLPNELLQVITQILNNCIDELISAKKKEVMIDVYKDNTRLYIDITNSGKKIEEDILKNIFLPYYSTKGESSNGLGLYLASLIAKNHLNGEVLLKENIEDKVTFSIII